MSDSSPPSSVETAEKMLLMGVNSCPFYKLTGMECTMARGGRSTVRLPFKKELTHPGKVAQGGVIAAAADAAMSLALISLTWPNTQIATIELKINYLKPFKDGEIQAIGEIVKRGSKVTVGRFEVTDNEGEMVAVGLATFSVRENHDKSANWGG